MRDRATETIIQPRDLLSLQGIERLLCVAPHPDDEVLGCGGLLAALADRGCAVHTLILTCGEQGAAAQPDEGASGEIAARRREESKLAAAALGLPPPEFLAFEDRSLHLGPALIGALAQAMDAHAPQVLLLPSLSEPHPDHQAAALAGLAAARSADLGLHTVLFYESGAPLQANVHLPIDAVAERKWRAVRCFASQLGVEDYEGHARAMAAMRAFGLRPACREAESFFKVDLQAVRERGALAALPQWPWVRERLQLANDPAQCPLVSVLVRSMDRDCLPEALASVALQTYPNLELVVVNASGHAHRPLNFLPTGLAWRLVEPPQGTAGPLARAQAANLALQAATGELSLFLDDDDLIEPHHLERLVGALVRSPGAAGAYAGVRVEAADGAVSRVYDLPWSRQRLEGVNFLPIHAVLFRMRRVRERSLRFDESLPVLEDWSFWLQLTEGAELLHCPGVSAVYRQTLGASALSQPLHPHHWRVWHARLLQDRLAREEPTSAAATLAWHAVELDSVQAEVELQRRQLEQSGLDIQQAQHRESDLQTRLQQECARAEEARVAAGQLRAALESLQQRLDAFGRESQSALAAREEALQRVAAEGARRLAERELEAQRFAATAQSALEAKELELQTFAQQAQCALDAKEAELQSRAQETARIIQALEAEHAARSSQLEQQLALALARLTASQQELRAIQSSRSWRWTALLRRRTGLAPGLGS